MMLRILFVATLLTASHVLCQNLEAQDSGSFEQPDSPQSTIVVEPGMGLDAEPPSVEFDIDGFEEFGDPEFVPDTQLSQEETAVATGIAVLLGAVCSGVPALILGGIVGFLIGRRRR